MKLIIAILTGIITFCSIIFWIDPMIVNWCLSLFPESVKEWFGVIKLILWIILLFMSLGLTFIISYIMSLIVALIISAFE